MTDRQIKRLALAAVRKRQTVTLDAVRWYLAENMDMAQHMTFNGLHSCIMTFLRQHRFTANPLAPILMMVAAITMPREDQL